MSVHDTPWPAGTPCWVDLAVPDVAAATAFYGDVLGWSFVDSGEEFGHYHIAQVGGRATAAVGPVVEEGQPSVWTVYLATDDADATAKLITEHGGSLLAEPMDIPGNGRMALALDPTGGAFGIWQSAGMHGFGLANEPGAVTWTDARVPDPAAAREFYAAVFGYTYAGVEGAADYVTFHVDGRPAGGMTATPEGVAAHWLTYFSVADTDAAVATAARAGATVLMPAEDTDFGRIGILTDPFGAVLALHHGDVQE
jgi:uncharacterized protein